MVSWQGAGLGTSVSAGAAKSTTARTTRQARKAVLAVSLALALGVGATACGVSKPAGGAGGAGAAGGSTGLGGAAAGGATGTPQKLTILHTGDMHSHLMGHSPEADYSPATVGDDLTVGGMARLATAIKGGKATAMAAGTPTLLLDAGDFAMGTLFEFLETTVAPELQFMQALGYDATTVGNHELDWTPDGLAGILNAAKVKNGVTVPILATNMKFSATDARDDNLALLASLGMLQPKLVKMVGTLKVGFIGLLGSDAVTVTPQAAPLTFDPIVTSAMAAVTELRTVDKVDLVIALSHSGVDATGAGEDAVLAMMVPGIDIIISGHTHVALPQPVVVGKTLIVSAGSYTEYLGKLDVTVTPVPGASPTVKLDAYKLLPIDDTIAGDVATQPVVDAYIAGLDSTLTPQGLGYKKVIAATSVDLALPEHAEAPVGNLVADAYRTIAGALQPTEPPAFGFEANGQLRSPILKGTTGSIWFADLFRVTPIGIGPDQLPGFSLVTFYLNAKDIASGLELGSPEFPDQYFLQLSGIKATYNPAGQLFSRVVGLSIPSATPGGPDTVLDIKDTTKCYKVVATNYVAGLLGVVKTFTKNALEVTAKDKDCVTPIDPTVRFVDADPTSATVQELKHWQAVLKYVSMFKDTTGDGIPDVPAAYGAAQGRIVKQ